MRKSAIVFAALLVAAACGDSTDQAATTTATTATKTLPPALPLVDLVANYHAEDFLPVPEDLAKLVRYTGLIPFAFYWKSDPEFSPAGGPFLTGEFCPGLSWMAAALNNKKVSNLRLGTDGPAGTAAFESVQKVIWVGVAFTAIHDVDVGEFASALDEILIATGGTGNCSATTNWAYGTKDHHFSRFSVVELRAADVGPTPDADVYKIRIGVPESHKPSERLLDRSVAMGEKEWFLDRGEFAISIGVNEDVAYLESQFLAHLEKASTALHIHVWANQVSPNEEVDVSALEELITDFSVELGELTINKLLGWLVAHQAFGK